MTLVGLDGDELTIQLPTRFLRDWVRSHYGDKLNVLWRAENGTVQRVDLRVGTARTAPPPLAESLSAEPSEPARVARADDRAESRFADLAGALDPRFSFDAFVVGKPNEFAYACARRVAERRRLGQDPPDARRRPRADPA
jgi:chromosomal replication initiator protein